MSLNEFIIQLEEELTVLPKDRREEIIAEFKQQIDKAMELGDTEEYLLKILGKPSNVAEKFIKEEVIEETETETIVKEQPVEKMKMQPVTGNFAEELRDFNVHQLEIAGDMVNIKVQNGDKFGIKFLSYTHKGKIDYGVENGRLKIVHSGSQDEVKFKTVIDFMKKRKQLKKDELTIIWPNQLDKFEVFNKNGKVVIHDIEADEIKVSTEEGLVETAGLTGDFGEFKSSMGALKVESSEFKNLFMETEMGRITVAGVTGKRYHLVTNIGKIHLDNFTVDSDMKVLSKMGTVSVNYREQPKFTKIVARANVGKVKNALAKNKIEKQMYRAEYMSEMGSVKITNN